jgi:SRSO17 transposase
MVRGRHLEADSMRAEDLLSLRPSLDRFLKDFEDCAVAPTRELIGTYVRGQLGPQARKSIEPIALEAGVAPRTLQELLSLHQWDQQRMQTQLYQRVHRAHSGRHVIGLIDETSCAKKGDKTPGVQRQYCGASGKIENCVVTVHLGLADGDFHALLDAELYLPQSWADDRSRCRAAKIPDSMTFRSKTDIALELIDQAAANSLQFGWLTFDEGYGGKPPFLSALIQRDHRYVGEVPKTFMGWSAPPTLLQTEKPPRMGRPRQFPRLAHEALPPQTVEALAALIPLRSKITFHVKDTHTGPEVWVVGWMPFFPKFDGMPGPVHWLIVALPVLGGDPKYFVSNASAGVPLEVLLHVAFSRWHIERCFEDDKGEIGLDHFEVRNYLSLKRHLILSAVSFLFLAETNQNLRGEKPRLDALPSQAGDRSAA